MLSSLLPRVLLLLIALSYGSCSSKDKEGATPALRLVGRWDVMESWSMSYNADGRVSSAGRFDFLGGGETYHVYHPDGKLEVFSKTSGLQMVGTYTVTADSVTQYGRGRTFPNAIVSWTDSTLTLTSDTRYNRTWPQMGPYLVFTEHLRRH